MKKSLSMLAGVLLVALGVYAHEMPEIKLMTYINGGLNLVVMGSDFTRTVAGVSGDNATDYSRLAFEVQAKPKGADDSAYETITGEIPAHTAANQSEQCSSGGYFIWQSSTANFSAGSTHMVRVRARATASDETTDWSEGIEVFSSLVPAGTLLSPLYPTFSGIADGKISSYFEKWDANAPVYGGRLFGHPQTLTRVRFVHRHGWSSRAKGAVFEVADDAAFTQNVRTVHTIPSTGAADFTLYEIEFPEPVTCLAARVRVGNGLCCNFDEVEWCCDGEFAGGFTSDANMYPTVTWSMALEGLVSSRVEWSFRTNGTWMALGDAQEGCGPFVATNEAAVLGMPLYYRVRASLADGSEKFTQSLRYTRVRRLDRSFSDETTLLAGNQPLNPVQFAPTVEVDGQTRVPVGSVASCRKVFDADLGTWADIFYDPSFNPCETLVGLQFPEPCHVVAVEALPRVNNVARQSFMSIRAAKSEADYQAHVFVELSPARNTTESTWYRYESGDTTTTFTHLFGWCNSSSMSAAWFGNTAEMRFYGWSASDEVAAGMVIATPTAVPGTLADLTPSVSWTVSNTGYITQSRLEYAYQPEGPWTPVGAAETTEGTFVRKLTEAKFCVPTLYRVVYDTADGMVYTDSITVTSPRVLERNGLAETSVREGVQILPTTFYAPANMLMEHLVVEGATKNAFDANESTFVDTYFRFRTEGATTDTYVNFDAVVGVEFLTPVHVTEAWLLPRGSSAGTAVRLDKPALFAAQSQADIAATNIVQLSGTQSGSAVGVWKRYMSSDAETAYRCVFVHSPTFLEWNGDMAEMHILGWREEDAVASGAVFAPSDFRLGKSDVQPVLAWTAIPNAERIVIERRMAGEADWTVATENLPGTATEFRDVPLRQLTAYEYRLTVYGLSGKMVRTTEPLSITTPKGGMMVIFR